MSVNWAVLPSGQEPGTMHITIHPSFGKSRANVVQDVELLSPWTQRYLAFQSLMIPLGRRLSITLGCDPSACDVIVMGDRVSERHARLFWQDGCYFIEDLCSVMGTFVNGRKVTDAVELQPGDKIGIWPHVLVFK